MPYLRVIRRCVGIIGVQRSANVVTASTDLFVREKSFTHCTQGQTRKRTNIADAATNVLKRVTDGRSLMESLSPTAATGGKATACITVSAVCPPRPPSGNKR
ncbi:hypothetical protein LBMAG48_00920 [Phycisphaerae bacterium]|nr:hypothetical protein LBMAG48_00920 [Phycisphaerae bacterium]